MKLPLLIPPALLLLAASCAGVMEPRPAEENRPPLAASLAHNPAARAALAWKPSRIERGLFPSNQPHIVLHDNPEVRRFVEDFSSTSRLTVEEALPRRKSYLPLIERILDQRGLPRDLANIAFIESRYNAAADGAGTSGMWQLTAPTARSLGLKVSGRNDERKDAIKSTAAAAQYLNMLYEEFHDWFLVVAAYNYGPANIRKAVEKGGSSDIFFLARKGLICGDVRDFVAKFIALSIITRNLDVYGFSDQRAQSGN